MLPDYYTFSTASGEHLVVGRMGDPYIGFHFDSEQKPETKMTHIFQLRDVIYVSGLTSNLLSLPAMAAGGFGFHGKGEHIIMCGRWLHFPIVDGPYSLYCAIIALLGYSATH